MASSAESISSSRPQIYVGPDLAVQSSVDEPQASLLRATKHKKIFLGSMHRFFAVTAETSIGWSGYFGKNGKCIFGFLKLIASKRKFLVFSKINGVHDKKLLLQNGSFWCFLK